MNSYRILGSKRRLGWFIPFIQGGCFECGNRNGRKRPLAATRWERPLAATCWERPLAAACGHSLGAATRLERPLAATRLERPLAATCGHSSGCEWLRAGRKTWQSWHLEKNRFCWKSVFFKFGGWIGRILSCLTKPCGKPYATHVFHSMEKILGRSINGGGTVEN